MPIFSLAAGHTDLEIAAFLEVSLSFVYEVRREWGTAKDNVATV